MDIDEQYLRVVDRILTEGELKENRTGVDTLAIAGEKIEHDMSQGFPLLTTKQVYFKGVKVELEGFIKGIRSKRWYAERGCKIWNEWCNPQIIPYGNDTDTKARMAAEDDLGLFYGVQWRDFKDPNATISSPGGEVTCMSKGVDQLRKITDTLEHNPNDRRMICSAWNPQALGHMALPPCHLLWQTTVINGKLNLAWYQRSVDVPLGLPFNIASYALLLDLLALHAGLKPGRLIGFLMDTHVYVNQIDGMKEQFKRGPRPLPTLETSLNGDGIYGWSHYNTEIHGYDPHPAIQFPIAV